MDKTETYIKMSDCPEIQELWKPDIGGWDYTWDGEDVDKPYWFHFRKEDYIWLPRQDQLQEMVHNLRFEQRRFSGDHGLLQDFAYWAEEESNLPCASMEELWLAFVMKEKYNKVWNGEEWKSGTEIK